MNKMIKKQFWNFRNLADGRAELLLYGDIAERSWFGDEVIPKQFAEDLNNLGAVSEISVRIISGGDVFAAQAIGNLLEEHPAQVTAHIDGICASSATIVACHCNRVLAASDSTYMIHPVCMGPCGYLDEKTIQEYLSALAAVKENIIGLYTRKTGRNKEEIISWMDKTSWWTAEQAKEHGFVDELVCNQKNTIVENRSGILFMNSVNLNLPFYNVPEFIQNRLAGTSRQKTEEGIEMAIETVDKLREQYPTLVDQIEQAAAQQAICEERQRIQDIEDMALPGSEELTNAAKFENPVSASDYAKAAMKLAKEQSSTALMALQKDASESGVSKVQASGGDGMVTDEFLNAIRNLNREQKGQRL